MTILVAPGYAPLEQYYGDPATQGPWTDIYGLGATCWRAIGGRAPLDAIARAKGVLGSAREVLQPAVDLGRGRYSQRLLAAVDHALQLSESDRPQNVADWRREIVAPAVVPAAAVPVLATASAAVVVPTQAVVPTQGTATAPVASTSAPGARSSAARPAIVWGAGAGMLALGVAAVYLASARTAAPAHAVLPASAQAGTPLAAVSPAPVAPGPAPALPANAAAAAPPPAQARQAAAPTPSTRTVALREPRLVKPAAPTPPRATPDAAVPLRPSSNAAAPEAAAPPQLATVASALPAPQPLPPTLAAPAALPAVADKPAPRSLRDEQLDAAEAALRRGSPATAAQLLAPWAAAGVPRAQTLLGRAQESSAGRQQNDFEAYIWYSIAARSGEGGAQAMKDKVAARLQPAEIRQAQQVIDRWKPRSAPDGASN